MNYEKVVKNTKKIESILENMGAKGKGLYEKSLSIETKLDESTLKSIRFIATIRNKLLHEDGFELTPHLLQDFLNKANNIINTLGRTINSKEGNRRVILGTKNKKQNETLSYPSRKFCFSCKDTFQINDDDIYRFEKYQVALPDYCGACKVNMYKTKTGLNKSLHNEKQTNLKNKYHYIDILFSNTTLVLIILIMTIYLVLR